MQKRILRTNEAAEYTGFAVSTLEKKRHDGGGPPFVRLSARAVGYFVTDLDEWLNARRAQSTSTPRPAV